MPDIIDISTKDTPAFLYLNVLHNDLPKNSVNEVRISFLDNNGYCNGVYCSECPLKTREDCVSNVNLLRFIPIDKYPEYHI